LSIHASTPLIPAPKHPAWFLNLVDNPQASIQIGPQRFDARPGVFEGDTRETLWTSLAKRTPQFEASQAGINRQIPLVVLERV
jgi:deazaflavin-dependent oxidoreductase (nitroreductase family)